MRCWMARRLIFIRELSANLLMPLNGPELNDRFYRTLSFGTGGLRGRTIGKIVTAAERGKARAERAT